MFLVHQLTSDRLCLEIINQLVNHDMLVIYCEGRYDPHDMFLVNQLTFMAISCFIGHMFIVKHGNMWPAW